MNINLNYEINFDELKGIEDLRHKIDNKSVLIVVDINKGFAKRVI